MILFFGGVTTFLWDTLDPVVAALEATGPLDPALHANDKTPKFLVDHKHGRLQGWKTNTKAYHWACHVN
jgi:hypothetical protein